YLNPWLGRLYPPAFSNNTIVSQDIVSVQKGVAAYGTDSMNGQTYDSTAVESSVHLIVPLSFNSLNNTFQKAAEGHDPLIGFIQDCQKVLQGFIIFIMTTLLTMFVASFAAAMAGTYPVAYMVLYTLCSVLIVLLSFSTIFLPPAAMGGYYLPLIPVLIYSACALSWLMQTVEAVVAAPFVAVALIHPSEDDFGKAEVSLSMTLQVVLKPALMIMGLVLGGRLSAIGISLLAGPVNAYMNFPKFAASEGGIIGFLIALLMNQVIVYLVIAITTRCFSLIYRLPDQTLSWIKHRGQDSDVRSMVNEARSGAEQSIQMMQQIFEIANATGRVALDALKTVNQARQPQKPN
ncbi:MAG: hypothetical protein FJ161_03870, partial [Gammaproteobacteria bacterium]|nr:hypothetical protein [Gammaproteobacteria bacterium]